MFFGLGKVGGREAPEIHGDDIFFEDLALAAVKAGADDFAAVFARDVDDFFHVGEKSVGAGGADAAIHATVVGESVFKVVADDGVVGGIVAKSVEEIGGGLIGVGSIEVVSVDDGKRFADDVAGSTDGVGGSPGLFTIGWDAIACGEVVEFLESVVDGDAVAEARPHSSLKASAKSSRMTKTTLPKPARMASKTE